MRKKNMMDLSLENREWKTFIISDEFEVKNSKAYHKESLQETKSDGISYVTRTNLNNGVESIVEKREFKINQANTIVFGAENATFFYQPNKYITGNKMYFIEHKKINKYIGLFLQLALNKSIENCGFGYGKGLTGTRVQRRYVPLPITSKGKPDYDFMEQFIRNKEQEIEKESQKYIQERINQLKDISPTISLAEKEWREFKINDIFNPTKGDQNQMSSLLVGHMPLVSAKNGFNGLKGFVSKNQKKIYQKKSLTLNNDGDGGAGFSYYQPFDYLLDSHVTSLSPKFKMSKHTLLFISRCITKQRNKFGHGYAINNNRLTAFKIMLPINRNNEPDYVFMENYMKNLEYKKLIEYIKFKNQTI